MFRITFYILGLLIFFSGSVFADCTSPAARPGSLNWNETKERYEVCSPNSQWRKIRGEAQIVSGTTTILINSSTESISLTTNGTTWGYLTSGASYLPTITSARVSSTYISTTYMQLSSATVVLACETGLTGTMRYTSGTMQVCDGNEWTSIAGGIGVPTGTISAFEAASCPAGWSEYTPARGRFLRGMDNGAGNDPDWPRLAGSTQDDVLGSHLHSVDPPNTGTSSAGNHNHSYTRYSNHINRASGGGGNVWNSNNTVNTGSGGAHTHAVNIAAFNSASTGGAETRAKNVAVIFCQYAGYSPEGEDVGVSSLTSLSDVVTNGATTGDVLSYDGATWVAVSTESAISPTMQNSWVNYGSGYAGAGYFKDVAGIVHLQGLVSSGTGGVCIFTLPAGYRPLAMRIFSGHTNPGGAVGRIDVQETGCVKASTGVSNAWLSLDGITFRAEQ